MAHGRLIVFEGVEGAGKSTQLRRLAEWIGAQGSEVVSLREPGGTALGEELRRLVLHDPASRVDPRAEAMLFMASRAQLLAEVVRPAMLRGATVLMDRFFLSTYAYQGAGRGLDLDAVRDANRLATSGLTPDLTILLRLDPAVGLARAAARAAHDRMERAAPEFHDRVARAFEEYAGAEWQRMHPECGSIVALDANGSPAEIFERVRQVVVERWPGTFPSR